MIDARELCKRFGELVVLRHVTISAEPGEVVGLLGPNGAGKSTLIRVLTGYHAPDSGEVRICGVDLKQDPVRAKAHVGYLPEHAPLYDDLTAGESLEFAAGARLGTHGISSETERVLEACQIQEVVDRPVGLLSKGYRQRVGLAIALLGSPDVLILDEPMSGLDPNQADRIRLTIREASESACVLLSTHALNEAEALCDRVIVLNRGEVVARRSSAELAATDAMVMEIEGSLNQSQRDSLSEVGTVESVFARSGSTTIEILIRGSSTSADLFDWARARGLRLRRLERSTHGLVRLFSRLTDVQDGPAE